MKIQIQDPLGSPVNKGWTVINKESKVTGKQEIFVEVFQGWKTGCVLGRYSYLVESAK